MRRSINVVLLSFLISAVLLFFAFKFSFFPFLTSAVQHIFSSPKAIVYTGKAQAFSGDPQLKKLQQENLKLTEQLAGFEEMKKDNDAFRSQFENSPIKTYQLLPARVIGFLGGFDSPTTLIIDRGSTDGIKKGMTVIFQKNLVGIITTASQEYSQIMVPTNKNFTLSGKTLQDNTIGIINGAEDFLVFNHVVITDKLTQGDLVATKGEINNEYIGVLPDIIVGKIYSINKTDTDPFQTAQIKPLVNYSKLTMVFVVTGEK